MSTSLSFYLSGSEAFQKLRKENNILIKDAHVALITGEIVRVLGAMIRNHRQRLNI